MNEWFFLIRNKFVLLIKNIRKRKRTTNRNRGRMKTRDMIEKNSFGKKKEKP